MNNSTTKRSSRAIRICALPLALLVAVSASAATNSWTQATEEVWKSDTNWTISAHEEKAELFNARQTATASKEATPSALEIVTPTGLISISRTTALTLKNTIPGTQTEETVVKAVLACLEKQTSSASTDQQLATNRAVGTSQVNLAIIPANSFNSLENRAGAVAKENVGRILTGRLSGMSETELVATAFSNKRVSASQNTGATFFAGGNFSSSGGGGTRSFAPLTSRKPTEMSFADKLEANTSIAQSSQNNLPAEDERNISSVSDQINVAPSYVTELGSGAFGNVTGIASYIVQNNLLKDVQSSAGNAADLANIGIPKQHDNNSASLMVSTGYSITTGYQEVPATHFVSTATTLGSSVAIPQSSGPAFEFNGITTVNNAPSYAAVAPTLSNTDTNSTVSFAQFSSSPKAPTLRRALSIVSAPGDKTTVLFATDGQLLKDNTGAVLSAGSSANGDGMAVQIGYYSTATVGNNFSGTWIPLSGQNAVNSAYLSSSIGDEGTAGGIAAGEYYSGNQLEFIDGDSQRGNFPSLNTIPLSLRFYNAALISNATLYNTVSDDLWLWKTPGAPFPLPPQVIMSLADAGLEWEGGGGSEFKTTLVIPEPTSALLLALGAAGLLGRRRRRA